MNEPRVVESVTNECQSLGRAHESSSARAEQLIACLEGEIAKRDARIAELEARIVWLECESQVSAAPVPEAKRSAAEMFSDVLMCQRNQVETLAGDPYMVGLYNGMSMMIANFDDSPGFERLSVAEAKAQSVVMPEQIQRALDFSRNFADSKPDIGISERLHILGLANLLEKEARLNAAPVQQVSVPASAFASMAITHYEAALLAAFPSGSSGEVFNQWNEARRVLAAAPSAPAADAGVNDHD